jgi:FkbM family methyltransferase
MYNWFKLAVKRAFLTCGLDIQRRQPECVRIRTSLRGALRQLSSLGFNPRTVIDVGVAFNTQELYEEFAQASIILIEPLTEFEPALRKICQSFKAQYVLAAASDHQGMATINVHSDQLDCSSLLNEAEGPPVDGFARAVPTVTIDQVCLERAAVGPYLIKADVQGAELLVLDGAAETLRQTQVVVLEVTLLPAMKGGPQLYDVVSYMKERGFVVYDIFGFIYRPFDNALCQVDIAFVPDASPLRMYHGFATPEQRHAMAFRLGPKGEPVRG